MLGFRVAFHRASLSSRRNQPYQALLVLFARSDYVDRVDAIIESRGNVEASSDGESHGPCEPVTCGSMTSNARPESAARRPSSPPCRRYEAPRLQRRQVALLRVRENVLSPPTQASAPVPRICDLTCYVRSGGRALEAEES